MHSLQTTASPLVSLVGAGPGDPELITLKALRRIQNADVILIDSLVHPDLLAHARANTEIIDVGKIPGGPSTPQDVIHRMLIEEAHRGKKVVRLKGGDPFVFGRGSEEALVLARSGIAVEVIPGVSSSVAAPAAAFVPVTHRGIATQFTVITGHGGPSADALLGRWKHLAKAGGTLVFLMGMKNLVVIQQTLLAAGMNEDTKVAFVERATWESERVHFTSLRNMHSKAKHERIAAPSIIVIGDVVKIGEELSSLLQNIHEQNPAQHFSDGLTSPQLNS